MNKFLKYLIPLTFLISLVLTLSTCKKYPENTLWFKRVKKIKFFDNVRITSFTVNGVDSLSALNKYFGSKIVQKDITSTYIMESYDENYGGNVPVFTIPNGGNGTYHVKFFYDYSKNKKKLDIFYDLGINNDTTIFARSLFVNEITTWDIIKFEPKGTRKLKTNINSNIYEIQFN